MPDETTNLPLLRHELRDVTVIEFTTPSLMDARQLDEISRYLDNVVVNQDRQRIVLDYTQVKYISSQAVGLLLTVRKNISSAKDGKLVLCGVNDTIMQLLTIVRLHKVLDIRPEQNEAVRACSKTS